MKVIIITQEDYPKCKKAIASYRERGIDPKIYHGLRQIPGSGLRSDLMAELMANRPSGDPMRVPIIFEDGKLVEWEG